MVSEVPIEIVGEDEEFDWESAVREIDLACLKTSNASSSTNFASSNLDGVPLRTESNRPAKRQSTLDRFIRRTENKPPSPEIKLFLMNLSVVRRIVVPVLVLILRQLKLGFIQLTRFHRRDKRVGWTRQKLLHLMIGSSNTGSVVYFVAVIIATCRRWHHWSNAFGFLLMAFPKILFLATFLLLLSFWVDVCHQGNGEEDDDDDEEENSIQQVLLEKSKSKAGSSSSSDRRKCCSFHGIHLGTRQKFVVAAVVLLFILMISFAILIWIGSGKNPIDSSSFAEVYVDIFAAIVIITGGGICFYGLRLLFNLKKVRSEQASSEMRKVAGLAGVSVVCFTVSSLIALLTKIPLFYHWNPSKLHGIEALVLLIIYYFIGSTVPLGFVLWVLRDLPAPNIVSSQEEPRRITYVNIETRDPPQHWTSSTISKNVASKASPI